MKNKNIDLEVGIVSNFSLVMAYVFTKTLSQRFSEKYTIKNGKIVEL